MAFAPAVPRLSPDGLAVSPAGVIRSRVDFNPASETEARLQRARERLYVLCQTGGWLLYSLLFVISYKFYPRSKLGLSELELNCAVARVVAVGWLITHFARPFFARFGWKELGWRSLVPRIALAAAVMGFLWCAIGFLIDLGLLRMPWNHEYSITAGFLVVWMQASLGFVGWLCLYFFYHVFERLNRLQLEQLRLVASVKEAELRALKSQLNPHFLFNSLNSLRALIDEDAPRAREAVTRLANMLRYSLQSGQLETVPFEEELRTVQDYLALEQIRHEDRLSVRWDIGADVAGSPVSVPPMLLQTLVENAVKYGISPRREGGELVIAARFEGPDLRVRVTNPGQLGAPAARAGSTTGVGLRNASERLKLLFGDRARLALRAEPPGHVTADVLIPLALPPK